MDNNATSGFKPGDELFIRSDGIFTREKPYDGALPFAEYVSPTTVKLLNLPVETVVQAKIEGVDVAKKPDPEIARKKMRDGALTLYTKLSGLTREWVFGVGGLSEVQYHQALFEASARHLKLAMKTLAKVRKTDAKPLCEIVGRYLIADGDAPPDFTTEEDTDAKPGKTEGTPGVQPTQ